MYGISKGLFWTDRLEAKASNPGWQEEDEQREREYEVFELCLSRTRYLDAKGSH